MRGALLHVFVGLFAVANAQRAPVCSTPNSTEGECISLSKCTSLREALAMRPLMPKDVTYLRRSQCGYDQSIPDVCCPKPASSPRPFLLPLATANLRPPATPSVASLATRFGDGLPEPGECGNQFVEDRVFDGQICAIDEFPWMALVEYNSKNTDGLGYACSGFLITDKFVLTAAHCVVGPKVDQHGGLKSVRLGEYNTEQAEDCDDVEEGFCSEAPIDVGIENVIPHPKYKPSNKNQHNDIALVKIAKNVPFSTFISPICLPSKELEDQLAPGKLLYGAGWGQFNSTNYRSPVKLKVKLPIVANNNCNRAYRRQRISIRSDQLCAGGGKGDTCYGDNGGPLMTQVLVEGKKIWYSFGLVSYSPADCENANVPAVYTKVSSYLDWIKETVAS